MSDFRADLHCHSTCSDGTMSPKELIFHAKQIGLKGLCITDHDTITAYETAIAAAKEADIRLGTGVEFSSVDAGTSVHILGYDIDIQNPKLLSLCERHTKRRKERNKKIIENLRSAGIEIELKAVEEGQTIGRPHIAQALLEKGVVSSIQEAFQKYIGDGRPYFDPGTPISTDETLAVIHDAGGKAFLAHPHLMRHKNRVLALLEKPFDGIECFYSKCLPSQEKTWVDIASKRGLLMSGGSDFHGTVKPGIELGCSWVDEKTFNMIFEKQK